MPTILSAQQLKALFIGTRKSFIWMQSVQIYHKLRIHADGEVPIHLIRNARPNESDLVRKYRIRIYEPETVNPIERVFGVLEKIRRSPDWMMRFNEETTPKIIIPEETLQNYMVNNYPVYGSFENWLFEEALRNAGLDANSVIAIIPKSLKVEGGKYVEPIAQIFNANKVVDFLPDDYAVLKTDELSSLLPPDLQQQKLAASVAYSLNVENSSNDEFQNFENFAQAQVYYHVNTLVYEKWELTEAGTYQLTEQLVHGLSGLPVFQMPGKFVKRVGNNILKKSPIYAMVPHLNKAARESNDLDAGIIKHLHLQKWRINNTPCVKCSETGKVKTSSGVKQCPDCKGTGMSTGTSPFDEVVIKPSSLGTGTTPTPPVGYVNMDTAIITIQNDRVEKHIYRALESVNMEHLSDVQLNQSGLAKTMDKDEATTLVYMFGEYMSQIANNCAYWFNEIRYLNIVPNKDQRQAMLPVIPVPEKFDVINSSFLLSEYQTGKTAGLNSTILAEMQKEIAQKKFYANPKVAASVQTVMDLDPFPDKTIEEKGLMESQGLATKADIILSNYISDFVGQLIETDNNFLTKTKSQKREALMVLANAKVAELDTATQVGADLLNAGKQNLPIPPVK